MEVGNYVEYLDSNLAPADLDTSKPLLVKTVRYRTGDALIEDRQGKTKWVYSTLLHVVEYVDSSLLASSESEPEEKSVDAPEPPKPTAPSPKGRSTKAK